MLDGGTEAGTTSVLVDTEALAAAGTAVLSAAARLGEAGLADARPDFPGACGDAALAATLTTVVDTWARARRALTTDLDDAGRAFSAAAALLDDAESATARHLAGLLATAPAARAASHLVRQVA